jgi:hypothetical protein
MKKHPVDLGSAKSPLDFGHGCFAYKRDGHWRYRTVGTKQRFGRRFVEVTDHDLMVELEARGYQILFPAHECVDRPELRCPAYERNRRRTVQTR